MAKLIIVIILILSTS